MIGSILVEALLAADLVHNVHWTMHVAVSWSGEEMLAEQRDQRAVNCRECQQRVYLLAQRSPQLCPRGLPQPVAGLVELLAERLA